MTANDSTNGTHHQNGTAAAHSEQAWLDAIDAVTARARTCYGASLSNRITKARHFILDDQIEVDGQFAFIPSENAPATYYTVSSDGCD